jgi:hypothetical protein
MRLMEVLPNLRLHRIKGISIAQRVKQSVNYGLGLIAYSSYRWIRVFRNAYGPIPKGDCAFLIKSIATRHKSEPTHIPFRLVVNAAQDLQEL